MSSIKKKSAPLSRIRTPHEALAREAREWDERARTPEGFVDAPEAIPNASRSTAISIRIPTQLLELLKTFASREEIGYQVLIKRWLDDRLRDELAHLKKNINAQAARRTRGPSSVAPGFPLKDRAEPDGPHYDDAQGDP